LLQLGLGSEHTKLSHRRQQIETRKIKILEPMSKGESNQSEIARMLQIDRSFVCGDKACFGQQAQEEFRTYLDQRLPMEYELCFERLKSILKESWRIESDSGQGIFCYDIGYTYVLPYQLLRERQDLLKIFNISRMVLCLKITK